MDTSYKKTYKNPKDMREKKTDNLMKKKLEKRTKEK